MTSPLPTVRQPGGASELQQRLSLRATFAALKHPNYRLWFVGQLVSLVGTWMQTTAQGFLIFQLTHSAAFLGYVGFAAGVPTWLFTLYGGVIADRMSRRTLLVITQTTMLVLAFLLAGLTFGGMVQPWHIIALAFGLGVANAFDAPTRQAFVLEMVEREDLTNAIALNAAMFNSATAVGPAVAGLTYALLGPAWCFTINGLSFIAVIAALLLMKLKALPRRPSGESTLRELGIGLRYVGSNETIRTLIGILGAVSLFGLGMVTLMPAWSVQVLHGGAATNGVLLSARGVGSLLGGLMLAALGAYKFKGRLLMGGAFIMAVLLVAFSGLTWLPASLLALAGVGLGFMLVINLVNALVQTSVPDELRGRVMGIYTLVFFGLMPVGSLLAGIAAEQIGEQLTVAFSGVVLLGLAVWAGSGLPWLWKLE